MNGRFMALALFMALSSSCMVGPNYKRPAVSIPSSYRGPAFPVPGTVAQPGAASFGDLKWWNVFHDPVLQNLIRTALAQNYNLRIAAARILQAEGQLKVTRSQEFPQVKGTASATHQKVLLSPSFPSFKYNSFQLGGNVSWLLDFWGEYRRATEAARADLLASVYNQRRWRPHWFRRLPAPISSFVHSTFSSRSHRIL